MRTKLSITLFWITLLTCQAQTGFKETQLTYPRVRNAYQELRDTLEASLHDMQLETGKIEICLRAFKKEKLLEIWIRKMGSLTFSKFRTYHICHTSGILGPKRRQGDLQIPEGFYHISVFNPWSNFHLSLCINYPNRSDRILGVQGNLGGDICIHGSCVTIGCIPLTDPVIKEVYLLCVEARNNGQEQIPVTIFPSSMGDDAYEILLAEEGDTGDKVNLWSDLKRAYDHFETDHRLPAVSFLPDGRHEIR